MNLIQNSSRWLCSLMALTVGALLTPVAAHASTKVVDLQVQVDVPPTWHPFLDDDVADALVSVMRERFRRQGFPGVIERIEAPRAPNPDLPLLSLRLIEWRITRTGNSECTLSAAFRPASEAKEIDVGLVTHTDLAWIRERGRFGLARAHETADALEGSASGAMRELYQRIAETGRMPGFETKKRK